MKLDFDHLLLDESPDAVIATTQEGNILYWSKGAEAVFGYTSAEAVGRSLNDTIVPADWIEEERRILREGMETGFSNYESLRRKKDGSLVYVVISSRLVRDAEGKLQFILSSKKDVSHLKVLRDAKLLEANFGHLLAATPDGIVMANPTGRIVLANGQAEKLFGYGPGELRGILVEALIPERFRGAHVGHRAGYFSQPHTRPMGAGMELYGLRKDGTEFPVEISLSPFKTEAGTLVMSAVRDISERKRFERELQEKNTALEAANQELEAFSYSISHDLRAPLRAMGGFARILEKQFAGQLAPEAQQAIQRIRDNAAKMGQLIDGLLDFSSLNWMTMTRKKVYPAAIARAVFDELRPEIASRRVEMEIPDVPACKADAKLLKQVFANLLSNALKYTRGRDPAVIKVGWRAKDSREARGEGREPEPPDSRTTGAYFVQDNGAGFDMKYAGKLFRVFQRLHNADEFEGTGVGLAIVRRIIHRHGGRVWAEAQVDRGATFYFTLGDFHPPVHEAAGRPRRNQVEAGHG